MFGKDITKRISTTFVKAVHAFFKKNLPDRSFPAEIDANFQLTRDKQHGDLTSNIAMRLASVLSRSPQDVASGVMAAFREALEKSETE